MIIIWKNITSKLTELPFEQYYYEWKLKILILHRTKKMAGIDTFDAHMHSVIIKLQSI